MSTNHGANWATVSTGLTNLDDRYLLANGNDLYLAAVGGVWKRPLSQMVGINQIGQNVPEKFELFQNYPNPFNPSTNIKYQIAKSGDVKLIVYDVLGNEVATLVNEKLQPGTYEIEWNAFNYPSVVYFYKLTAGDYKQTNKMILLK